MRDREEGDETGGDFPHSWFRTERLIKNQVTGFVEPEPKRSASEKLHDVAGLRASGHGSTDEHDHHGRDPACRGTHVAALHVRGFEAQQCCEEGLNVLETIAIILIVLWLLGMVSGYTLGNFIWVLLVIAVVLFLVRLVSGRRVV
jgi:hypothetical protein